MKYFILEQYNLILIRYGEVWLKSQKVKIRMLKYLMGNIKNMLTQKAIPFHKYQLSKDSSRIFFFFDNKLLSGALEVIQKAFGVHSYSPALRTSSKIENIIERTIEVAKEVLSNNDTFALRVKRSGNHEFSSLDVARIVGKEIIDHFPEFNLKVNLSDPQKKIFIEIRDDFSYIFTDIYETRWGGLPIEPQKKICVMDVGRIEDLIAGFFLMRRGSKIYPILFDMHEDDKKFKIWLANWMKILDYVPYNGFKILRIKFVKIFDAILSNLKEKEFTCAFCRLLRYNVISQIAQINEFKSINSVRAITDGLSFNNSTICSDIVDLQSISLNHLFSNYPMFTPLASFSDRDISSIKSKISEKIVNFDYCKYKPQNQKFDMEKIKNIYHKYTIEPFSKELASLIEEINLN